MPFVAELGKAPKGNKFQKRLPIKVGGIQNQLGTIMDIYQPFNLWLCEPPANYVIDGFEEFKKTVKW